VVSEKPAAVRSARLVFESAVTFLPYELLECHTLLTIDAELRQFLTRSLGAVLRNNGKPPHTRKTAAAPSMRIETDHRGDAAEIELSTAICGARQISRYFSSLGKRDGPIVVDGILTFSKRFVGLL
jgi:hypothetical protein